MNYISKNWDKDTDAVIEAVQAFHEIGSNTDKLVQHMIPVTGLIESLNIVSESSKNYISQLVKGMPQDESDAAFLSLIYDYFSKGQADTSVELTELYKNGQFGSNTAITEAYQLLLDSSNIQEQMEKLNIDVNKQTENIEVLENKIGSIVESVDGVSEKIDEAFSKFSESENLYYDVKDYKDHGMMDFYIISETSYGAYEVAMPEYNYYGKYPSNQRAILYTTDTRFSYKGWAWVDVAYKGKKEIRLNEEYGGFTQLWDVYEEVTEYDLELLDTVESEMKFRKEEIQKESKKLNQARKEMYQVCLNEIKPVYDTITELKAGILVLEERRKNLNQKLHDL
ncbi:MAG: hypothetical protein ACOX25_12070 [Caldicoprobacterales bacterium]|jgi:archaellum component FlaC